MSDCDFIDFIKAESAYDRMRARWEHLWGEVLSNLDAGVAELWADKEWLNRFDIHGKLLLPPIPIFSRWAPAITRGLSVHQHPLTSNGPRVDIYLRIFGESSGAPPISHLVIHGGFNESSLPQMITLLKIWCMPDSPDSDIKEAIKNCELLIRKN